jgi:HAMP domain-containing protein
MIADATGLLVALAVPIVALVTLVGLFAGVRELERSRDELIELGVSGR